MLVKNKIFGDVVVAEIPSNRLKLHPNNAIIKVVGFFWNWSTYIIYLIYIRHSLSANAK